jgi:hypothetical protein
MKRQIFTALSLTLLVSSPLTLNAGKNKNKNKKLPLAELFKTPSNTTAPQSQRVDNKTNANTSSSSALTATAPTPVDEFSPDSTKAQRAALFVAIGALANQSNKGLKPIPGNKVDHELERQRVIRDLYTHEDHAIIAAPTRASSSDAAIQASLPQASASTVLERELAVSYLAAHYRLKKTQQQLSESKAEILKLISIKPTSGTEIIDLFPPTTQDTQRLSEQEYIDPLPFAEEQQQSSNNPFNLEQPDDFDKASISSSNGDKTEFPDEPATIATSSSSSATTATTTATPTPAAAAPAQQPGLFWRILGYKVN